MATKFHPKIFDLEEEIPVYCITAESFPEGVPKVHENLHTIVPFNEKRRYFGISWGGTKITYKAASTEIEEGELEDKQLEAFTIRKGRYISSIVDDFDQITEVMQQLIADPRIDPNGYCVEMYLDDKGKTRCMVTMKGS